MLYQHYINLLPDMFALMPKKIMNDDNGKKNLIKYFINAFQDIWRIFGSDVSCIMVILFNPLF